MPTEEFFVFTFRSHLLGNFLEQMAQLGFEHTLFGFQYSMIDPWPADPVRVWSLAAYTDDEEDAPDFIASMPIIRAGGGKDDYERAGRVLYRYGLLDALQTLWENRHPDVELLDLTVRVRDDVQTHTLKPVSLEPSTTLGTS